MRILTRVSRSLVPAIILSLVGFFAMGASIAKMQEPTASEDTVVVQQEQAPSSPVVTSTTYLPSIGKGVCTTTSTLPKNAFGVQAYGSALGYTGSRSPYFCELIASGATWLRNEASWAATEPSNVSPSAYNWTAVDRVVYPATRGVHMVLTINFNPTWAASYRSGVIDKVPLSEFTSFVGALVERYDGDGVDDAAGSPVVEHFEFYNEPDAGVQRVGDVRWGDNGEEYAAMLAAVYPVVKAANPNAKVLLGGIAYDWFVDQNGPFVREFLDTVLENGGGNNFDIMNFHQYPPFAVNWGSPNGPGLLEKTAAIRAKLAEYGIQKPIFITEAGMHSNSPETPENQARYVTMLYTQVRAADIEAMIWFMLYDPGEEYPYRNGLITSILATTIPQRKPAYNAYQTTVSMLAGAQFDRTLSATETGDEELLAYRFVDKNSKALYVAWLGPISRTDSKSLRLSGSVAVVRNIYGASSTVTDGQDGTQDGFVNISVGAQPVFITIQ